MPKMTGAQFFAEALQKYGVTHIFFVPTILSRTLFEVEKRTNIRRILTHGEKAAAYMADGYARACGRPGVCMSQVVGSLNLAAGLRDAYLACSPVIAFTGGSTPLTKYRNAYQELEDILSFEKVTKFNARVDCVERFPDLLRQAFRVATSGTPGPVHLEFAGNLGEIDEQEADIEVMVEKEFSQVPAYRTEPVMDRVREAALLLAGAKRPVIIAGGGVRTSGAGKELVELAEKLCIPVATSLNAKETIPGDHPLSVGVVGLYSRRSANQVVLDADLVFFIGSRTGGQVTNNWQVPPIGTPAIQLDINAEEIGRNYPLKTFLLGDAKVSLLKLIELADSTSAASRKEWAERAQSAVREWRKEFVHLLNSEASPIRPERICKELTEVLPSNALLVSDTGHSGLWTGGMVDLTKPGQSFIRSAGHLGWGFPAALGAKCAFPNRPVLLFTGDAGLWYHLSELETAVRWGINAVILVNNNHSQNQETKIFDSAYGGKQHGRAYELWHFSEVNFAKVAESMGAVGIRVERPGELKAAIEKAFAANRPVVLDVVTDISALAPPAY